jgi:hypothetical protein
MHNLKNSSPRIAYVTESQVIPVIGDEGASAARDNPSKPIQNGVSVFSEKATLHKTVRVGTSGTRGSRGKIVQSLNKDYMLGHTVQTIWLKSDKIPIHACDTTKFIKHYICDIGLTHSRSFTGIDWNQLL